MKFKWILFVRVVVGNTLIKIPSSAHLRYDRFNKKLKSNIFIHSMLEVLSDNIECTISSNLINVCYYIAEYYEDEFVSAAGDSGLTCVV